MDLLSTHNKILEIQIVQQATSFTTPPGRLSSMPEQNLREQCNAIVLRSGTQLEGPKGISDGVGSERGHDEGPTPMPSRSVPEEKRENEK